MHPKARGQLSEAEVLPRLMEIFDSVLTPVGDNERYDALVELGSRFLRLQIKTARDVGGALKFQTCSSTVHVRNGSRQSYHGQIEAFVAWSPTQRQAYLIPIGQLPNTNMATLRLAHPANNQLKGVRWAADYELGTRLGAEVVTYLNGVLVDQGLVPTFSSTDC